MSNAKGTCETCTWWDTSVSAQDDPDNTGRCARRAPLIDFHTGRGAWPITESDEWCGDVADTEQ